MSAGLLEVVNITVSEVHRPLPATIEGTGRGSMPTTVRNHGHDACVANVAAPASKQADVAAVLGDGVGRASVGVKLDEEPVEGVLDGHGGVLGFRAWSFEA